MAYVAIMGMWAIKCGCSASYVCITQQLTLTVGLTFVVMPALPIDSIPFSRCQSSQKIVGVAWLSTIIKLISKLQVSDYLPQFVSQIYVRYLTQVRVKIELSLK